ncbi:hypothetical protein OG883_28015 [Streptomyces sp. NBC_01142]|uniref:DUF6571 family protein n=1 Tax=Streptomyces sp. NBC_01142 TaxID=2975865 RepID=UPI00225670AE|nr:DUF6571 family protein [Streptomyces sp. NBC_01142]MCX4823652.1 hypothetical protein [Streptomyces sp. NBC_01142]
MVTCQELQDLNLGKLNTAVTQWQQMLNKLVTLADGGDGGINAADLERKANAADWKGDNATVTKAFTTTTARQFDDVVTEARSIHKILQEAHTNLKKNQDDLKTTIDKWSKKNVYIDAKGGAMYAGPPREVEGGPKEQPSQEVVDTAAAEVGRILDAANETDRIAARALRKHAQSTYDFDEKGYTGLKDADAQQGIEDADAMVKLAGKGDGLTDTELKHFNEIAKYHRDNPAFAERFATKLGPEGTLEFWRSLADPGRGRTPDPDGDRAKLLAKVQDNLGITLANATQSHTRDMQEWKDRMIELGDDPVKSRSGIPSAPYGFQVLGPLMTEGKWDTAFLNKYGEKLLDFERTSDDPVLGGPEQLWENRFNPAQLSYPPGETKPDSDPVANLMEALGHNPEASLQFFNGSSGKGGKDDLPEMTNWDYLVNKDGDGARAWPADEDGKSTGYKYLGHALESGTLGYAYDDKSPSIPPMNTEGEKAARDERTLLMDRVVDHYKSADVIDKQDGIRDSLANMAAGHIDSLNYSMGDWGGTGEASGRDGMYGAETSRLHDFGETSSTGFLRALASDKDSYETVSTAQQVYGASSMAAQGDNRDDAMNAGLKSVRMHGLLDEARAEAIGKEFADDKSQKNLELEKQGEWRKFAAEAAIGVGVGVATAMVVPTGGAALIAVPIAIETIGGAANTQVSVNTLQWLKDHEFENHDDAVEGIAKAKYDGTRNAMTPLLNYAEEHGIKGKEFEPWAGKAESNYNNGGKMGDTDDARGW